MPAAIPPPPSDLLQRIPLSALKILDIGCGRGSLAAAIKNRNPRALVYGTEEDPDAAAAAEAYLDGVAVMNIEAGPVPFQIAGGFDCIVVSAVLPHMQEPWAVLRRLGEALASDGTIILCVPNIEHWSFTDRLLRGSWDYEPTGLLDRGHLRWFSLESTRRGLTEAGLLPVDVQPRVFDLDRARRFTQVLSPTLMGLGINPDEYTSRAAAFQHIWRARKTPPQRLTLAGNMLAPIGGVSHVRVVHPFQALATEPEVRVSVTDDFTLAAGDGDGPRIFILHRPVLVGAQGMELLRRLMDAGWLVITEFDDHPDFFTVMQNGPQLSFRGVHAVQTSTEPLADTLRERNPEVMVFPNAIVSLPEVRNFANHDSITLFFGALNREQDWAPLMQVINEVAAIAGPRLKFQVVHDEAFFNALTTPHKTFTPICDYETYNSLLGECEISFMPLLDNPFNRAKSDLKFIEASAHRVVSLASEIVYGGSIVDRETGLLFRDPEHLRLLLMRLIVLPEWGKGIGDNARFYVARDRMLAYQVAPRLAWYRSLWERKDALTAAMWARLSTGA